MNAQVFLATSDQGVTRAELQADGQWRVEQRLGQYKICCLASSLCDETVVYAGTRDNGVLRSSDSGNTWTPVGLAGNTVKSIAICKAHPATIYAGTKPPALYASHDGGTTWTELESFRSLRRWFWYTPAEPGDPYVMGLAVSPTDPNLVIAGIEFGGMFRSTDGGKTWQGHLQGTSRDCHNLKFHHTDGNWVYQGGGGWPAAVSADGGMTWTQPRKGLAWSLYGMACAADPADPAIWYVSAAPHAVFPELHKMPRGHFDGEANAFIFRKRGGGRWERLAGGLPQPLDHMAYALVTDPEAPGHLYAGLSNGDVWHTADHGDSWRQLPFNMTRIQFSLIKL